MPKKLVAGMLILLLSKCAIAQLEGDIKDKLEKAITNAAIIAVDSVTKKLDSTKTDERGYYAFKGLIPGRYRIEVRAPGFLPNVSYININQAPAGSNDTDDTYYAETLDFNITDIW